MSDHPAVVTVKVSSSMSSGRKASIANVMTVINNPEKTTLRTVIASEIKAANPSLGFDDTKHIAAVETGEETNIKQLLDLPMSILLKQQVGIQDGVIHVTVDMPSPIMKKPPPRAASKGHTVINNKNRINPFRDSTRENFPPLNELFRSSSAASPAQTKQSSLRSSPMNLSSISSRASSTSVCNDFALDMSIAGQAAMAHHRYQIEKYGIDGDKLSNNNNSNDDIISPLSEEKDWDHLMDSNESVALTDVNNTLFLSRVSESQLLSPLNMTDVGDSYFDKSSVIEALKTPEKTDDNEGGRAATKPPMCGVTLSRGGNNNNDLDYSTDENSILGSSSPDASSQVTTTSGLNGIFRAAMRLHDDLDNDKSSRVAAADGNESSVSTNVSMSRKGRKSLSVSFAMDESFAIERQSSSKKTTHRANDEDLDEFGDFLLSPIGKEENKDVTFHVDSSFIAHQPSPSSSCVKNSCLETSPNVSPSNSGEMASTPTASGGHKQSTTMSILRSKSLDDEFFRRKLEFDSPGEQKGAASEIGIYGMKASPTSKDVGISSGIIRKNSSTSSVDKYCSERLSRDDTHTTTPLDESSFVLSHKETQALPSHGVRVFGSDASSRLNSQTTSMKPNSVESSARTNASNNSSKSADRKGAEASGVSKFFAFGFDMIDMACSSGSRVHSGNNSI